MAAERQHLDDELTRLKSDLRSLGIFAAAGLVVIALVTWRLGKRQGAAMAWKLGEVQPFDGRDGPRAGQDAVGAAPRMPVLQLEAPEGLESLQWRRRESNPRPRTHRTEHLRA